MKLLVVSHGFPPRGRFGTEFYTRELALGLAGRGHEVQVLHPVGDGSLPRYELEEVEEEGLRVTLLHNAGDTSKRFEPSYRDARVEARFDELLARERPDLVHFTYLLWGLSVRLPVVARARGIPAVVTLTDYGLLCHRGQMFDAGLRRCHGPHPADVCARCIRRPGPHDLAPAQLFLKRAAAGVLAALGGLGRVVVRSDVERREAAVREALDAAAHLIAPTSGMAAVFRAAGVPDEKLTELVYAFDETPYVAARATPAPASPRFGFLAQFGPHKGLDTLIEAARLLHERAPERAWELVLHGAPAPGRHALFPERVLARRIPSRVRLGEAFEPEDAPRIFSGFSAIVLPAAWDENAPLSVLQARSVGVPVLGTDVPGIAEVLEEEAARQLVPVGDAAALADRMQAVLDGRVGRATDPGLPLSLAEHLDRIESLYSRILETLG